MLAYVATKPTFMLTQSLRRGLFLGLLLGLLFPSIAQAKFMINSAEVYRIKQGYLLDADIDYQLNPRVEEAIANGIPLIFINTLELRQTYFFLKGLISWARIRWQTELRYEIRYLALSQKFILRDLNQLKQRSFSSLHAALEAMGSLDSFKLPILPVEDVANLTLRMRSSIDLQALPAPMQPGAFISREWHLTSPWAAAAWL